MRLRNLRPVGRYVGPDGHERNVWKGTKEGRSVDVYFYLHRCKRCYIAESDLRTTWIKIKENP